ncbi:MAG: SagB/ThcOx family dehydrogenase [Planctomycetota bacterium]|jgi:nitroreductase
MVELITLPEPDESGSMPLEQAIAVRRSRRHFLPKSLTLEQIGQLAWTAQGQDEGSAYRTTPSAGATYPLELFVITDEGMYLYLPDKHALEKLIDQDLRLALASAAWGQEFIQAAPLTFIFAAEFTRTTGRYGKRGIRYVYMEAGHVGAFDDNSVSKVLSLPQNLEPLYMVAVGYYRE